MSLRINHTSIRPNKIKVGLTIGDPSGIGPAIALKAIQRLKGLAEFVVIGDSWVLNQAKGYKLEAANFELIDLNNINQARFKFGKISAEYGRASIEYLDKALELIKHKQIDCLVTCPISKESLSKAGYKYSGHTEYLAQRTNSKNIAMLLLNRYLKISLITRHIPLMKVAGQLNKGVIISNIILTNQALKNFFHIGYPRLVICGLNPHASDNGVIGREENEIIKPALKTLKNKFKLDISGPISSDVAIYQAKKQKYDCIIAIYHDQALIPLKLTGIDSGVNMTLGLPFIRTSPLHGTAFDIAGIPKIADPSSLIAAIELTVKCASNLKKD
ncbi:MAG: 4-hydroxythreonine-4-phosphate dehydrogenase PdxA [Candidatus Omnitrophica bacterium]|nr:4-hydroxythreonine-4-phosphate dehydrogenase PdxA [Candidatus Omnitrophota bacterium]